MQTTVFNHERLDVYRTALAFTAWCFKVKPPYGLGDQLRRAAQSTVLNIAEGAQQQTVPMAKKHYRIALGSAAECAAALDLLALSHPTVDATQPRELLQRTGMMLRKLAR